MPTTQKLSGFAFTQLTQGLEDPHSVQVVYIIRAIRVA